MENDQNGQIPNDPENAQMKVEPRKRCQKYTAKQIEAYVKLGLGRQFVAAVEYADEHAEVQKQASEAKKRFNDREKLDGEMKSMIEIYSGEKNIPQFELDKWSKHYSELENAINAARVSEISADRPSEVPGVAVKQRRNPVQRKAAPVVGMLIEPNSPVENSAELISSIVVPEVKAVSLSRADKHPTETEALVTFWKKETVKSTCPDGIMQLMSGLLTTHIETCADESTRKLIVSSWDTEAAKLYPEWLKSGKRDNLICLTSRCAMECLLSMLLSTTELTESELSVLAAEGLAQV